MKILNKTIFSLLVVLSFYACAEQSDNRTELTVADYSNHPLDLGSGSWPKHYVTPSTIFLSLDIKAGDQIRVYLTPYDLGSENPWWQLKLYDGHWWPLLGYVFPENDGAASADNTQIENGYVAVDVTEDIADKLKTNTDWGSAMVIQGEYARVHKVTLVGENLKIPEELVIWKGEQNLKEWDNMTDLGWGRFDWSTIKPDSKIRIYCEVLYPGKEESFLSLRRASDWEEIPGIESRMYVKNDKPYLETVLTKEILENASNNDGIIIMGVNVILKKITSIEPKR